MADRIDGASPSRGGSRSLSQNNFLMLREIIRGKHEALRVECETVNTAFCAECEAAAVEQWQLMAKAFKLSYRLPLSRSRGKISQELLKASPGIFGLVENPTVPTNVPLGMVIPPALVAL